MTNLVSPTTLSPFFNAWQTHSDDVNPLAPKTAMVFMQREVDDEEEEEDLAFLPGRAIEDDPEMKVDGDDVVNAPTDWMRAMIVKVLMVTLDLDMKDIIMEL